MSIRTFSEAGVFLVEHPFEGKVNKVVTLDLEKARQIAAKWHGQVFSLFKPVENTVNASYPAAVEIGQEVDRNE